MKDAHIDTGGREWAETRGRIWRSRGHCDLCAGKRFPHQHLSQTYYYCMNIDCRRAVIYPASESPDVYRGGRA